jgi:apoptosis-inducing factor 3
MNYKEIKVANINELNNGEMKAVSVGEGSEILLCKTDNKYSAFAAYCTHYGAPLADGLLSGGKIICPWHHACFNSQNGTLLEPPAMDSLPSYEVQIKGNDVIVKLSGKLSGSETPRMEKPDLNSDKRTFVIIGAGAAGNSAALAMREAGFKGRILIITQENRTPYDRPNLSKDYLQGIAQPEWMPLRSDDFYKEYGIEFLLNKKVKSVDAKKKKVFFGKSTSSGETDEGLDFDKLLLATGGVPRKLNIPGSGLKNIFYFRSFDDSDAIIEAAKKSSKAVIIGASFIGMETAFSLSERGLKVTVVAPEKVPFENVFGNEIGNLFKKKHEEKEVKFKLNNQVKSFEGNGSVKKVVLQNDEKIDADLVVIGIGVKPATEFLNGFNLENDGSIKVDEYLQVSENIFAAGDIASFNDWRNGELTRIEHWRTASQQGRIAGFNMAGKKIKYESVPFFWTNQVGLSFNYVGHTKSWDEIITHGDIGSETFVSYYIKDKKVVAAAGNFMDKELDAVEILMSENRLPTPDQLKSKSFDIIKRINTSNS